MSEISADILARLQAREEGLEQRPGPVPKGYYLAHLSYDESEIQDKNGYPILRPTMVIDRPEETDEGRRVAGSKITGRWAWFASENSTSAKPADVRQAITRRITSEQLQSLLYQATGNPDVDEATVIDADNAIEGMRTDDPDTVNDMMEALLKILDGVQFIIRVTHRADQQDEDVVWTDFRVYSAVTSKHETEAERAEAGLRSFEKGLAKAGLDTESVEV